MDAPQAAAESRDKTAQMADELFAEAYDCLRRLASTCIWWKTPDEAMQFPDRISAQVMNPGTWDDLNKLAEVLGQNHLRKVLREAEAGQFDARSWHYWHYRLGLAECGKTQVLPMPVRKIA